MPQDIAPAILPDVDLETRPFSFGGQSIEDAAALKIVNSTFFDYENYRRQNHDNRWTANDALYVAAAPVRMWEGSRIPRASHSQPIVFEKVETAHPLVQQAIFGQETSWFQVEPEPGGDPAEARAILSHLTYLLEHDHDEYGRTARREIDMATKQLLIHGNGGISVYWDPGKKRPCIEWVDLRDIYTDPGITTPDIEDGRSTIRRKFYTVEELDGMRNLPGMNIPEMDVLYHYSKRYMSAAADNTKTNQEAVRGVSYTPGSSDYSANPSDRKVEVQIYYSKSRIIWVVGREWVAYNGPNPYGFIPFCFAPCFNYLSRFYAIGYPDMLEGSQRYAEALYNKRLDDLSLRMNPPKIKKAGAIMTPSQERYFPGQTFQVNNPKEDIVFDKPLGGTDNIMGDVDFISSGADKIVGVNGALGGNFQAGNVNRTAGGVNAQVSGASSRLYYIIKNIEDYLIVPMLYKLYRLIQFHTNVNDLLPALGEDDKLMQVGAKAFQSPMRFRMIAASRMMSREKLSQMLPFISQYFLNGSLIQQLHTSGKTVDFDSFMQLIQDATGTGRQYHLIRPMTDQEQQALNQPPPQAQMQQQQKQQEIQSREKMAGEKNQTAIQVAQIAHAPDPQEQQGKMVEMAMGMHQKAQEARLNAQQTQAKMAQDQIQGHLDNVRKAQETALSLRQQAANHSQTLQIAAHNHSQKLNHEAAAKALDLHQKAQAHAQTLQHAEQQNEQKIKLARVLAALKQQEAMQPPPPAPAQD